MSVADYSQRLEDHQRALVLVQSVGQQLKPRQFSRLYERLTRLQNVMIPGQQRTLQLRYKRSYPVENSEWGDFQAHRKVIGLVCVGACDSENELQDLHSACDDIKQQYASTLFDSRLVVFGLNKDGSHIGHDLHQNNGHDSGDQVRGHHPSSKKTEEQLSKEDRANSNISHSEKRLSSSTSSSGSRAAKGSPVIDTKTANQKNRQHLRDPLNANSLLENANRLQQGQQIQVGQGQEEEDEPDEGQKDKEVGSSHFVLFYPSIEDCPDLEDKMTEFAASLFWVLESKRMDRSLERQDKLMLLMTPFEKKDFVGIDTDSR